MNTSNHQKLPASLAIDSLGDDLKIALDAAADIGFSGIAVGATHPQLANPDFGQTARRHLIKFLTSRNLQLSAIRTGFGAAGLADSSRTDALLRQACFAIQLAHDCRASCTLIYLGEPPAPAANAAAANATAAPTDARQFSAASQVLDEILSLADKLGVMVSIGSGNITWLARVAGRHQTKNLGVTLDSYRLIAGGGSPATAAADLAGSIFAWVCADAIRSGAHTQAVLLGRGQVDIPEVCRTLEAQNFKGPVVVDTRGLPDPLAAARHAASFLAPLITGTLGRGRR